MGKQQETKNTPDPSPQSTRAPDTKPMIKT